MTDALTTDQVIFVTGAARGIGAETARRLAARGARLALAGLEPERLAALAAELGPAHRWFACDVTDQPSLEAAVAGTVAAFGGIDVVLANAGIATNGTVRVTPIEALARTVDVNLTGVIRTVHATLPHVIARRGYYLLVSSAAAIAPLGGLATYAATKSGVEQFGNALRLELTLHGVRVGVAHPSWIDTDLVRDLQAELPTFNRVLAALPPPFGGVTSLTTCADAFVHGIATRARKVWVPRSLGPMAAIRQLFASPLADLALRRHLRRLLPQMEREVRALGRPFGGSSTGMGENGVRDADRDPA
jgi:NAD(P)-dependent dehydrogenase (short-subunit alcohol dehydrogenase family)